MLDRLKTLANPKYSVPIALSIALLAFLFSIVNASKVFDEILSIPHWVVAATFGLVLVYLVLKGIQFHFLLQELGISTTFKELGVSYSVGEVARSLPAGNYMQNYILYRIYALDFVRTSVATTAILVVEGAIAMIMVLILGIPGWFILRPLLITLFVFAGIFIGVYVSTPWIRQATIDYLERGRFAQIGRALVDITSGLYELVRKPWVVVRVVPLSILYVFAIVSGFYLISNSGLAVPNWTYEKATALYMFSLSVVLISPVSTHLGLIEASGVGAAAAFGYDATTALAMYIGFRAIWMGSIWLVCGATIFILHDELTRERPHHQQ